MSIAQLMDWIDPAKLEASLAKPFVPDEDLIRMHLGNRLCHYDDTAQKAGIEAALRHRGAHPTCSLETAMAAGVRAAMEHQA